jgi:hypothetical protein
MTPTNTISPEWQNENALRAYPLADDSKAAELIPTWLLSDIRVTCSSEDGVVFVSSVYVSDTLVSVAVSLAETLPPEEPGGSPRTVVTGLLARTVTRDALEPYRAYSMDRLSAVASGAVAFGEIPAGAGPFRMTFGADEAPLVEAAIVRAKAPGVTRISDQAHGTHATGIIDLSGNNEFRTSVDPKDPQTIVFTLSDIYRDIATSVCDATPSRDACGATPVRTINGVAPTADGTITLRFR